MTLQEKSYRRSQAISTNFHHISNFCKDVEIKLSKEDIYKAALWNYKTYGYGKVSLDAYIGRNKVKLSSPRLYNVDVKLWYSILKIIFERDNYTCAYCGSVGGKLEGDHIIPVSKGGTNELDNLTTSCRKCNRQKKNKTVSEFFTWRENKFKNA